MAVSASPHKIQDNIAGCFGLFADNNDMNSDGIFNLANLEHN